jgi:two-component system cell cycle response regulator
MRILIAEDNRFFRRLLEVSLKQWGHDVVQCEDGKQAWDILNGESPPRLAVLDWEMPKKHGVEICRDLRELKERPYVYVILLTAKNRQDDLVEGLESGADDYITKPFDPVELKVRLRAGTRIVQLQDDLLSAYRAADTRAKEDSLTGLWNHSAILDILHKELSRSTRQHSWVGVIMADMDQFKKINDVYGHLTGDNVLKRIAKLLKKGVRSYDSVGRYGGEEFLIVLPVCNLHEAGMLAERLRASAEKDSVKRGLAGAAWTMSLGVTAVKGSNGVTPDLAIRTADRALYKAKNRGRNCVEILEHSPEQEIKSRLDRIDTNR